MRLACVLVALLFVVVIVNGKNERDGNRALIARCGPPTARDADQVEYATWDGGRLVAVTCNDGRRFKR